MQLLYYYVCMHTLVCIHTMNTTRAHIHVCVLLLETSNTSSSMYSPSMHTKWSMHKYNTVNK